MVIKVNFQEEDEYLMPAASSGQPLEGVAEDEIHIPKLYYTNVVHTVYTCLMQRNMNTWQSVNELI